jgi:hypothetical protein
VSSHINLIRKIPEIGKIIFLEIVDHKIYGKIEYLCRCCGGSGFYICHNCDDDKELICPNCKSYDIINKNIPLDFWYSY